MERLEWAFRIALGSEEGPEKALLWFVAIVPWVKRWLSQHLYGLGVLVSGEQDKAALPPFPPSPGVILHELSHWLAAKALRVPTKRFTLGPNGEGRC